MLKNILIGLLFTVIISCSKEEAPINNNEIIVETLSYQIIEAGGVLLNGHIKNVKLPVNYGFVLSNYEGGTLEYAFNSKFLNGLHNGNYNIEIRNDLIKGETYYYNAVAYTSNKFVFGEEKSFIANGSSAPYITEVIPNKAHVSDTITIKGKYFSKNFNVFFDEVQTNKLIIKSDTLIKCIVPTNFTIGGSKRAIKIKKSTQEEIIYNDFSLYTPEVYTMEPAIAHDSDTITITGNHFDSVGYRNRLTINVYGNDSSLEIIESSRTKIKFVNAGTYYDFHPTFKLTSQFQTIEVTDKLKVKLATITGAPDCIEFGKTITITGTDFPRYNSNAFKVLIGGTEFTPKQMYRDRILLDVYNTQYTDFNLKDVVITYFDKEINFKTSICINEPWIIVGNVDLSLVHTYQNETYGIIYEAYQQPPQMAKFNAVANKFESLNGEVIPEEVRYGVRIFNKDKLYHYSISQNNPNVFRSYDIFTKQLKNLAPFPGEYRDSGLISSVGNEVYFGLGGLNVGGKYFSDIWKYSIQNDTWEFVTNLSGIDSYDKAKLKPLTFVIGTNIFIAAGQRNSANSDFWMLNTITKTVSQIGSLPSPLAASWTVSSNNATSYLNKGYYLNQYLEEYNANTNTWKTYSNIPGGSSSSGIFFHNGYLYKAYSGNIFKLNPKYLD